MEDLVKLKKYFQVHVIHTSLDKEEMIEKNKYYYHANITKRTFNDGLEFVTFHPSDRELFSRLFTMLDKTGDDEINYQEMLISMAMILKGDLAYKFEGKVNTFLLLVTCGIKRCLTCSMKIRLVMFENLICFLCS